MNKGFIRKLDYDEIKKTSDCPNCYLPHHPVVNPQKPEKVEKVCNAAAKYKGLLLNNKLMSGPNLLRNLLGIIFRFREKEYAITADIESMLLQVAVPKNKRKFLKFLWRSDPNSKLRPMSTKDTYLAPKALQLVSITHCRGLEQTKRTNSLELTRFCYNLFTWMVLFGLKTTKM